MSPDDALLHLRVQLRCEAYAACLDEERFAEWPDFFLPGDSDYRIVSRENEDAGLPAPLMGAYTHGMIRDRVAMLVKRTLTYRRTYQRRFVTNLRVERDGATIRARSNLLVLQSDLEGNPSIYMVGRCHDEWVEHGGALLLGRRKVIIDSFCVDNLIAIPL